jgi:hypothetical protein
MILQSPAHTQYLLFSEVLKDIPGRQYEQHRHPAVIFDRVTGPGTQVWGWWTRGTPARPCLLWSGGRGWGATVVEPEVDGADGFERASWSRRIRMLDRALEYACGPYPSLEELEVQVPSAGLDLGRGGGELAGGLLWGVRRLRAAHLTDRSTDSSTKHGFLLEAWIDGTVDEELARHALIPTLAKARLHSRRTG